MSIARRIRLAGSSTCSSKRITAHPPAVLGRWDTTVHRHNKIGTSFLRDSSIRIRPVRNPIPPVSHETLNNHHAPRGTSNAATAARDPGRRGPRLTLALALGLAAAAGRVLYVGNIQHARRSRPPAPRRSRPPRPRPPRLARSRRGQDHAPAQTVLTPDNVELRDMAGDAVQPNAATTLTTFRQDPDGPGRGRRAVLATASPTPTSPT